MSEFCYEELFRRLSSKPQFINSEGNPSSALFKDSKGVSVDFDGGRDLALIINAEEALFRKSNVDKSIWLRAIVKIPRKVCEEAEVFVKGDPVEGNPYHAIIQGDQEHVELSKRQARILARSSEVIKAYEEGEVV